MEDQKYFEIDVNETGVKLEAHGFVGNECVKATAKLEAAIGGDKKARVRKASFYQKVRSKAKAFIRQ